MSGLIAWCGRCKSHKPITEFWSSNKSVNGLQYACKPCCKLQSTTWAKAHRDRACYAVLKHRAKMRKTDPIMAWATGAVSNAKDRAKEHGLPCTITRWDVVAIAPERCSVLGLLLLYSGGIARHDASPSIDRIDNLKGYVVGNIRIISWRANRLKSDGTLAEHEAIVAYMRGLP